jgi:hypothetical protein
MSNNIPPPVWETIPKAVRWFNYAYSLPKVLLSSSKVMLGLTHVGKTNKPLVVTSSIAEDFARLWLHFAQKTLDPRQWDFLIIDSAGSMDTAKFPGCAVIRFVNVYHGQKIDIILRRAVSAEIVFLCDDDKYIIRDVMPFIPYLDHPLTPVVSLSPRTGWKFRINGEEFLPMGSYALVLRRSKWIQQDLRLQSPAKATSRHKIFMPATKPQNSYDTADYTNEQLLLHGYKVVTLPDARATLGFDGLSAPKILLMRYGKDYVRNALVQAEHYRPNSTNAAVMRAMYGMVKVEHLYRAIFGEEPRFLSGFSEAELREIIESNSRLDAEQRAITLEYFQKLDSIVHSLLNGVQEPV